jgi:ABC-type transport system substrate-binding protein
VGTGPFQFEKGGEEIQLKANPKYFLGRPFLDRIHILTVPTILSDLNYEKLKDGIVDVSFVPPEKIEEARSRVDWHFITQPVLRLALLGFNFRNPDVHDNIWRRRVADAIDPAQIIGDLPNYLAIRRLIPFSLSGSLPASRPGFSPDSQPPQAGRQHAIPKASANLVFCYMDAKAEARRLIHSRIIQSLTASGFRVRPIVIYTVADLLAQIKSGKPHLFLIGESLDYPDPHALLFRLFYSKSEGNIFDYRDNRVDGLLRQAETSMDDNKRATLYQEIERQLLEEAVAIPLFSANYSIALRKQIHGMNFNPLGFEYMPLRTVWIEKSP